MAASHDLGNRFRQKRMAKFMELLKPVMDSGRTVRILDVGGTVGFWKALPGLYGHDQAEITLVNLDSEERDEANLRIRSGNACKLDYDDMTLWRERVLGLTKSLVAIRRESWLTGRVSSVVA